MACTTGCAQGSRHSLALHKEAIVVYAYVPYVFLCSWLAALHLLIEPPTCPVCM